HTLYHDGARGKLPRCLAKRGNWPNRPGYVLCWTLHEINQITRPRVPIRAYASTQSRGICIHEHLPPMSGIGTGAVGPAYRLPWILFAATCTLCSAMAI